MSREMLLEEIVDYGNTIDYEIESNLSSLNFSDNSSNSLSSANNSDSDMNLDGKVVKPIKISNQEEKDRRRFVEMFNNWSKYTNPNQIYKSRKLSWSENKIRKVFKHYKTYNMFPNDHRSRSRSPLKLIEDEHLNYIIDQASNDSSISSRKLAKKFEDNFNIKISKSSICRVLKDNGFYYKSPKLRVKNDEKQQLIRKNWWERHVFNTNFLNVFFSDETTFYLDNPVGSLWLKETENIIHSKHKGRKIGAWAAINTKGKTSIFLYEANMNSQNYLEILNQSVDEMKEIIESDNIYLQMDNAKYHWTTDAFQFYYEKNVKLIDWPPYSPDLNPIENVWALMKRKISGRKFTSMNSLKNELYKIWADIEIETIEKIWMSIYDRIQDCIDSEGKLTNY